MVIDTGARDWAVVESDDDDGREVHVMPNNDLMGHIHTRNCACSPEIDDAGVVIHNSFDGREEEEA